jgi:phosphoglycerate dehydrogenase-like enzyme
VNRLTWNVLITSSPFADPVVGKCAREILGGADFSILHSPRYGPLSEAEVLPLLDGMDAIFASVDKYSAAVLTSPQAARLKVLSRWGVGCDGIDREVATRLGIVIAYTPGLLDEAVAEYALVLLLAIARRVHEGYLSLRAGTWEPKWGTEITGKTLGLVGCGRIGQAVAKRAAAFGMRVIAFDPASQILAEAKKLGVQFVTLDELLAQSDFVSLHAALTPDTRGLIGEAQLRRMKKSAHLINTSRGAIVDETALVRALHEGWIAGAALDAFVTEPLPASHPLVSAPNVLITPHQASFGTDTGVRVSEAAARAIADCHAGRRPQWVLNPEVFDSPALRMPLSK